jgi:uncharacterized membrane protein YdjX (TVP38/TMEM64 family)
MPPALLGARSLAAPAARLHRAVCTGAVDPARSSRAPRAPPPGALPPRAPAALAAAAALVAASLAAPPPADAAMLADAVAALERFIAAAGPAGPAVFIAAYAAAAVALVPASLLTVAAGVLFGPALGTAVVSAASTAGAGAAFLIGRYAARPAVERRLLGDPRFAAADAAIGREGAKIVLLLRLSPLFPYGLLNYALSLTAVDFWPYMGASWLGMLPGTVAYVFIGGAGRAAAEGAAGEGGGAAQLAMYGLGAAATLGASVYAARVAGAALAAAQGEEPLGRGDSD